jgi:hypothetical protein
MRLLLIIGGLAVLAISAMIFFVMTEDYEEVEYSEPAKTVPSRTKPKFDRADRKEREFVRKPEPRRPAAEREKPVRSYPGQQDGKLIEDGNVVEFGKEFENKWREDREKLGTDRHKQMEKLWFEGRRPRGGPGTIEKLKKIIKEFPDTNRAGCAALELGYHQMRNREIKFEERRKKAEEYWTMTQERYQDTICEYNSNASAMSEMALAIWVYRYTDRARAKSILEQVIEKYPGETDHLGQPLEIMAKRFVKILQ